MTTGTTSLCTIEVFLKNVIGDFPYRLAVVVVEV